MRYDRPSPRRHVAPPPRRRRANRRAPTVMTAARIAGLTVVAIGASYIGLIALSGLSARPPVANRAADLAVVFGNTVGPGNIPSARLAARLDAALAVYREGLAPSLLVSGGVLPDGRDEAAGMAAYLVRHGVPAAAIVLDRRGVDTRATARHAAALVGPRGRVIVVTQWFHIPRARLAMNQAGVTEVSGAWPRWAEPRDLYSLLREAAALPVYALRR